MIRRCPHCAEEIEYLNYTANYSETVYGNSSGNYDFEEEHYEVEDQYTDDSDNFEEDGYQTTCPECGEELNIDDVIENDVIENEKEEDEKIIKIIKERETEIILNQCMNNM